MHKHNFGKNLKLQSIVVILNVNVIKISFLSPTMYLCKFGGNSPTGSEDRAQKRLIFTVY